MKLRMAEKVILTFKRLVFRKKIRTKIVVDHAVSNFIFNKAWDEIKKIKIRQIQKYIHGFMTRRRDHVIIKKALVNEKNVLVNKCLINLEAYMKAFDARVKHTKRVKDIVKIQSVMRACIWGRKYKKLREKAIIIQRAYRDYIFRKKGAKTLFQTTYKTYADNLISQNNICRSALYDLQDSEAV